MLLKRNIYSDFDRGPFMQNAFDQKTKEYAIGRPTYPKEILNMIRDIGIKKDSLIADIGAGTGLLTNMLGELDCRIIAIEPNEEMLHECRQYCSSRENIECVHASAENTTLINNSIDIITIAQAFHWFDKQQCKQEFKRILKKDGYVMVVWNDLQKDSELANEYTNILHQYKVKTTAAIADFDPDEEKLTFFGQNFKKVFYDNWHSMTIDEFIGGALSLSYTPSKLDYKYADFIKVLRNLFSKYQVDNKILFHYKTEICICKFAK